MPDTAPPNRPGEVIAAFRLLYVYLAVGAVLGYVDLIRHGMPFEPWTVTFFFVWLGAIEICIFLVNWMHHGRDWARIAFIVLFGIGVSFCIGIRIWYPQHNPFWNIGISAQTVLGLLACRKLLDPDVSAWFKEMGELNKKRSEKLELLVQAAGKLNGMSAFHGVSDAEPLIEVGYHPLKQLWRIVWTMPFAFILLPCATILALKPENAEHELVILAGLASVFFVLVGSWVMLIMSFLLDRIRLYKDRIVKVRILFKNIEIDLATASYMARIWFVAALLASWVRVYRRDAKRWIARHQGGIFYEEHLMPSKDVDKLHGLLAALTGRKPEEFDSLSVDMDKLVKDRETASE